VRGEEREDINEVDARDGKVRELSKGSSKI
jgi:hypothetical protein